MLDTKIPPTLDETEDSRITIRFMASGLAVAIAALYYLIGFRVVTVLEDTSGQPAFGFTAGTAFLVAAVVIFATDRRTLWILGALAQAGIIAMYFNLAEIRDPAFEFWGIAIRLLQVLLLGALTYLAVKPRK